MSGHPTAFSFAIGDWFHSEFVPGDQQRESRESVRLWLGGVSRFITYTGLVGMPAKLERLLQVHRSRPLRKMLVAEGHLRVA